MPYSGKLSTACERCRSRRLKCGRELPYCRNCARADVQCPGYRDLLNLRFRDQSTDVARKHTSTNKAPAARLANAEEYNCHNLSPSRVVNLLPTVEDRASCYFFTCYVPDSHFFYLQDVYGAEKPAVALTSCVQAVAAACFANQHSSTALMRRAIKYYSSALYDINTAIKSPDKALLDSTIVAVMLLGLFEALVYQSQSAPSNQDSCSTHNEGALALLAMRVPELLCQDPGLQIFLQISSSIRVACFQRQKRTPTNLLTLHRRAVPFLPQENPIVRFFPILDDFNELQANIFEGQLKHSIKVVHEAARIDLECRHLMSTLHHGQNFDFTVSSSNDSWAYCNKIHNYPNGNVAQWWNSLRMTRIFLNQIIIAHLPPPTDGLDSIFDTKLAETEAACHATIESLAVAICASVGQFAQLVEAGKERKLSQSNIAVVGLLSKLFWPLCTVGQTKTLPSPIRRFAARCLYFLGTEARFPQALEAANTIVEHNVNNNTSR